MSDPFTTVLLVFCILIVAILTWVAILAIPVRISVSVLSSETEMKGVLGASWFIFGIELLVRGKNPEVSVLLGGARVLTRPVPVSPGPAEKEPASTGRALDIISVLPVLLGPGLRLLLDVVRRTRFDHIRGTGRIGLDDPVATGMMYGLYRAVLPFLPKDRIDISLEPEFNGAVLDIDMKARFHLTWPVLLLAGMVKIMMHPDVRKLMRPTGKKPAVVAS